MFQSFDQAKEFLLVALSRAPEDRKFLVSLLSVARKGTSSERKFYLQNCAQEGDSKKTLGTKLDKRLFNSTIAVNRQLLSHVISLVTRAGYGNQSKVPPAFFFVFSCAFCVWRLKIWVRVEKTVRICANH